MTDTRFSPPTADVADGIGVQAGPPPGRVVLAVRILWASMVLAIPSIAMQVLRANSMALAVTELVVDVVMFALGAYLIVSISRGRNWARVLMLVFTLLGLVALVAVPAPPPVTLVERLLGGANTVADVVCMVLLFTPPGSHWFRKRPG